MRPSLTSENAMAFGFSVQTEKHFTASKNACAYRQLFMLAAGFPYVRFCVFCMMGGWGGVGWGGVG